MEKIIIIKYGELSTKKDNINFFLKTLSNNIEIVLKDLHPIVKYDFGRMYVNADDLDIAQEKLTKVFGIHEIIIGYLLSSTDVNDILTEVLNLIKEKNYHTFKVETKRSDKNYPIKSMEMNNIVGSHVLKNTDDKKVDVHNPDLYINLEIRRTETLIYFNGVPGPGGYPVKTLGRGLLMLSGGIDSPVAGYMAIKRGVKIDAIYFEAPPHTSEMAKNKVLDLAKVIGEYNMNINVHVINFTQIQEEILKNIPHEYLITIMRRMMYRISENIAYKNHLNILINGESIGQVASQTLTSMQAINEVVKMPVIRPVACFDKLEIMDIARKIGTYDISIEPYEDCCTIFVPTHPVINPVIEKCQEYEKLIPYEEYIKTAIDNEKVIKVTSHGKEEKFKSLL
jgi:tRNA uracil 4-sulfurtransferase